MTEDNSYIGVIQKQGIMDYTEKETFTKALEKAKLLRGLMLIPAF